MEIQERNKSKEGRDKVQGGEEETKKRLDSA